MLTASPRRDGDGDGDGGGDGQVLLFGYSYGSVTISVSVHQRYQVSRAVKAIDFRPIGIPIGLFSV